MNKTFTFAGVSRKNDVFKVRYANDQTYVKVLMGDGHTDIDMIPLKEPMSKEDAVAYLHSIDFANGNDAVQVAMEAEVDRLGAKQARADRPPRAPRAPRAPRVTTTPSLEEIAARAVQGPVVAELEDAPY